MILQRIELPRILESQRTQYPFSVPLIQHFSPLIMTQPVTFLVGENGSGKSTLLEGIAASLNLMTLGDAPISKDPTLAAARTLGKVLKLDIPRTSSKQIEGFFMRAEDYFNYLKQIERERGEYLQEVNRVKEEYKDRSRYAQMQAMGPYRGILNKIEKDHGENADAQSHGEGFLQIFTQRIGPLGVFLIDEPEAALSPISQLGFLQVMKAAVERGSRFIIATHSPIILACPQAEIFQCSAEGMHKISYDECEHVRWYRDFLKDPGAFIHRL
jgi:predicted ATPase